VSHRGGSWRDRILSEQERAAGPGELIGLAAAEILTFATALAVTVL
jgi:hypothetical protein